MASKSQISIHMQQKVGSIEAATCNLWNLELRIRSKCSLKGSMEADTILDQFNINGMYNITCKSQLFHDN